MNNIDWNTNNYTHEIDTTGVLVDLPIKPASSTEPGFVTWAKYIKTGNIDEFGLIEGNKSASDYESLVRLIHDNFVYLKSLIDNVPAPTPDTNKLPLYIGTSRINSLTDSRIQWVDSYNEYYDFNITGTSGGHIIAVVNDAYEAVFVENNLNSNLPESSRGITGSNGKISYQGEISQINPSLIIGTASTGNAYEYETGITIMPGEPGSIRVYIRQR